MHLKTRTYGTALGGVKRHIKNFQAPPGVRSEGTAVYCS